MKKTFGTIVVALFACWTVCAQQGPWTGKLDINGTPLTIVFNFNGDECTMDSPDQGAWGIKAERKYSPTGQLIVEVDMIGATFEGVYMAGIIAGTFSQVGISLPLTLRPGAPQYNRPQTPVGPFPYTTEEVSFENGNVVLNGTLVLPEAYTEETPVVIMVTGSGIQNRDEEIFKHKPFAVIADALARAGVASLRYDDRGFGEQGVDFSSFTTGDFESDALAGVNLLRSRFKKVGIIGHSEGGTIALLLAAENKVDFVVSIAGAVIPAKDVLVWQNGKALKEQGFSEDVIKEYQAAISKAFDAVVKGEPAPDVEYSALPNVLKVNYRAVVQQCATPYFRYFLKLDASRILDKVTCPVLAFNGTLDCQVSAKENLEALRSGLASKHKTIVYLEDGNHLLQRCKTGSVLEYREIEETIAPEALELMARWISDLYK